MVITMHRDRMAPCLVWALDNYVRDYKALKYYCIIELYICLIYREASYIIYFPWDQTYKCISFTVYFLLIKAILLQMSVV